MTMIVGFNLSDKLYLAADSRVTVDNGLKADNVLKIMPILEQIPWAERNENQISVAIAGDVRYAAFLYFEIHEALKQKKLSTDIRELFGQIDTFCAVLADKWLFELKQPMAEAVLLFAGVWAGRTKKLNPQRVQELANFYREGQKHTTTEAEMKKLIETDPVWKIIDEKMRKEAGKSVIQSLQESREPDIPKHIMEAVVKDGELNMFSDSLIFSLDANLYNRTFKKESAEWGEWLAYGYKVSKDKIPQDLLAHLEFVPGKEKNQEHLMETALINITIKDFALKHKIDVIGGTVVVNSIKRKDNQILTDPRCCLISPATGFIYQVAPGEWKPMVPFNHFFKSNKNLDAKARALA
jgi:hypothetical protein